MTKPAYSAVVNALSTLIDAYSSVDEILDAFMDVYDTTDDERAKSKAASAIHAASIETFIAAMQPDAADEIVIRVDAAEHATILAALRFYQSKGLGEPDNRPSAIHLIATNDDEVTSLDDAGLDALCERIN